MRYWVWASIARSLFKQYYVEMAQYQILCNTTASVMYTHVWMDYNIIIICHLAEQAKGCTNGKIKPQLRFSELLLLRFDPLRFDLHASSWMILRWTFILYVQTVNWSPLYSIYNNNNLFNGWKLLPEETTGTKASLFKIRIKICRGYH